MQNYEESRLVTELSRQLDEALNAIALLKEENQRLKDEIATLKGQKPSRSLQVACLQMT